MSETIEIQSRDYWFKIVGMLQQNWALLESTESGGHRIYFIDDTSGVFDEMEFSSQIEAEAGLKRNGFARYAEDTRAQQFIACPQPPFAKRPHPNGLIYSSGAYWR